MTQDELATAMAEVEAVVNSRPLSYVSTEDEEEPLSPSHLMTGRRVMSLPDGPCNRDNEDDINVGPDDLTRRMVYLNNVLDHFWKRWSHEYLLELRNSHRQTHSTTDFDTISIGDIVSVQDENHPRGFWKTAKVEDLMTGRDGRIRAASVRVCSSKGRPTIIQRPIQRLFPLEITSCRSNSAAEAYNYDQSTTADGNDDSVGQSVSDAPESIDVNQQTSTGRPQRMAALNAWEIIRSQTMDT